jgi:hypothetical protein
MAGVEVAARGLVKTVGSGRRVLNDVSSTSRPGELVAIAGGSGAGKTMLLERVGVHVGALSGGQRKRASIAVELLTHPQVDLDHCDRVVFLARDGHLAFVGSVDEALAYFRAARVEEIYERLEDEATPAEWARRFASQRDEPTPAAEPAPPTAAAARRPGFLRQWSVLSERTFETLIRNPLTTAILLGSPALVVAMFVILFRKGAFDLASPSPTAIVMILFWVSFGAFFFGLTYGLLQIVTEQAILRREHLVGRRLSAYLLSKVTVLLPFLLLVDVLMLAVLRALDRLPSASLATYVTMGVTLALDAAAALTLGLLTSAAVGNPSQATLAMAGVGAAISALMPDRWAFEALGHDLGVRALLERGGSPLGPPLVRSYGSAGTASTGAYWLYLAIFVAVFFAAAWATLLGRCRHGTR